MEAIVKNRRQEILEKGEAEVKTLVEKKQLDRTSPETVARQRTREMIAPAMEGAETTHAEPKKESVTVEVSSSKGLCATCNDASHCAYAQNASSPILFCEMFDDSRTEQQVEAEQPSSPTRFVGEKKPASQLKGLCVNCEHRDTCTYPKAEGGVWHCEEYR